MAREIKLGIYKDLKDINNTFEILYAAKHTNNQGDYIVYKSSFSEQIWIIPRENWIEFADKPFMKDNKLNRRLEYVGDKNSN